MIRTVYGFDDLGRKVPTGSYDDGLNPVGGRIFYIDSNSDETVKFYDSNFNELSNVAVGDTPSYYKVTSAGTSGKEKYYIYYPDDYIDQATYGAYNILIGCNYTEIGTGKLNSQMIVDGEYYWNPHTSKPNIMSYRDSNKGGCSDWYLGSINEIIALTTFVNATFPDEDNFIKQFTNGAIISSSESNSNSCNAYCFYNGTWYTDNEFHKQSYGGFVAIRSF